MSLSLSVCVCVSVSVLSVPLFLSVCLSLSLSLHLSFSFSPLSLSQLTITITSPCSCVLCLSMSVHVPWKGGQRGVEQMASKLWHLHQHLPLQPRHSHHPGTMDDSNEQREFGSTLHPPSTTRFFFLLNLMDIFFLH